MMKLVCLQSLLLDVVVDLFLLFFPFREIQHENDPILHLECSLLFLFFVIDASIVNDLLYFNQSNNEYLHNFFDQFCEPYLKPGVAQLVSNITKQKLLLKLLLMLFLFQLLLCSIEQPLLKNPLEKL